MAAKFRNHFLSHDPRRFQDFLLLQSGEVHHKDNIIGPGCHNLFNLFDAMFRVAHHDHPVPIEFVISPGPYVESRAVETTHGLSGIFLRLGCGFSHVRMKALDDIKLCCFVTRSSEALVIGLNSFLEIVDVLTGRIRDSKNGISFFAGKLIRGLAQAGHEYGRRRSLDRSHVQGDSIYFMMLAVVGNLSVAPRRLHNFKRFYKKVSIIALDPEAYPFVGRSPANAEIEAAAAQNVYHRVLFGDEKRVPEGEETHGDADPDLFGALRRDRHDHGRRRDNSEKVEVMFSEPKAFVTQSLCPPDLLDDSIIVLVEISAAFRAAVAD